MRLIEAEQKLLALKQPVLQTNDVSALLKIPHAHASKLLERLAKEGRFIRLMRGKWATSKQVDPLILPAFLTAPFPSYISLQSALFYHGVISQIPTTVYAVTLSRTRVYNTPLGIISVHHIQPSFFSDFESIGNIKIATPEKALLDVLYLSPTKSNLFTALPELDLTSQFDQKKIQELVKKIMSVRRQTMVKNRLNEIFKHT